jgi:hypothetical protein
MKGRDNMPRKKEQIVPAPEPPPTATVVEGPEDTAAGGAAPMMSEFIAHVQKLTAGVNLPPVAPPPVHIEPVLPPGPLPISQLREAKVWAIWSGPLAKYIAPDGEPATAENLATFAEVAEVMAFMVGDSYPPHYSVALSLDASAVLCLTLMDCYDDDRGPSENAWRWLTALDSYSERCWTNEAGETAIRVLCRGQLPDGAVVPRAVSIESQGFVTLTTMRINPRPSWQGESGNVVRDCTTALAHLLPTRTKPQYVDDRAAWDQLEIGAGLRKKFLREQEARMKEELARINDQGD